MIKTQQKILLLDNGKEWGGGTNSMLELLKRLDRHRYAVTCCFYHNYARGEGENIETILKRIDIPFLLLAQRKQPLWAKWLKELIRGLLFFNGRLRKWAVYRIDFAWRIKPNARRIRQLLQAGDYDTLYMNNQPASNIEGYLAAQNLPLTVIQHCRIEPRLTPALVRMINENCHGLIGVSLGVTNALKAAGVRAERCHTVFNAIDIHQPLPNKQQVRQRLNLAPHTFIFGSIGSLITRKANHHILQALALFQEKFKQADWKMIIVGDGPQRQTLEKLAQHHGMDKKIIFAGFQNNALDYLTAFDTFILASQSEGLPRVVLEAMLVKTAIIGSNVVGTAELINNNRSGLLFDYHDIQTLFNHMCALYQNAARRQQLTEQAFADVCAHYAIENYVAGVERIFDETRQKSSRGCPSGR